MNEKIKSNNKILVNINFKTLKKNIVMRIKMCHRFTKGIFIKKISIKKIFLL